MLGCMFVGYFRITKEKKLFGKSSLALECIRLSSVSAHIVHKKVCTKDCAQKMFRFCTKNVQIVQNKVLRKGKSPTCAVQTGAVLKKREKRNRKSKSAVYRRKRQYQTHYSREAATQTWNWSLASIPALLENQFIFGIEGGRGVMYHS